MAIKWIKTNHKGLRYYEHGTRRHGQKRDRYYAIRFKIDKKEYSYGVGWLSDGIPEAIRTAEPLLGFEDYCLKLLRQYKGNIKSGAGPRSPKERRTIAEAERGLAKAEKERIEKESITFGAFMTETYLPQSLRDKKPKSYEIEEMLYRLHLAGTIGDLLLDKISAFHIERIKKNMIDKELSSRTIEYALQLIRHAFNTARKLGVYAGTSPTKGVKWPKLDNMKLRYLSLGESEILLAALAAKSQSLHDMALLSLHCGLRFGETVALKWSCVNWEAGTLAILNAKAGSRTAYLTGAAKDMLASRGPGRPDELIFPPKRSGGTIAQVSKVFRDTVETLGFNEGVTDRKQKVTYHSLRHTYATHLYESTHDLYLVQRSLGHASGAMSQRYAKMSENRLREGAEALEKAFSANGTKEAAQVITLRK